jgi:hypothetical protein
VGIFCDSTTEIGFPLNVFFFKCLRTESWLQQLIRTLRLAARRSSSAGVTSCTRPRGGAQRAARARRRAELERRAASRRGGGPVRNTRPLDPAARQPDARRPTPTSGLASTRSPGPSRCARTRR